MASEKTTQGFNFNVMDAEKVQLYHLKAVAIAGTGFFTDAYDLFCDFWC
ncbi:hypothetical protein TIFTF001_018743 [Ficus carica]|uniref:Uncharacterized protein n=1 Tax=Ficus carica TaxID=3494 RepID=A0AA88A511_FICCA|nr:hypothetical protein TIFTF001_018743 [Ficus carica]